MQGDIVNRPNTDQPDQLNPDDNSANGQFSPPGERPAASSDPAFAPRSPARLNDIRRPAPSSEQTGREGKFNTAEGQGYAATQSADSQAGTQPPPAKPRSKKPVGIIVLAVLVCASLVGAAVYAGILQTENSKDTTANTAPAQPIQPSADTAATDSEIEAVLGETTELPAPSEDLLTELSDQTLGL